MSVQLIEEIIQEPIVYHTPYAWRMREAIVDKSKQEVAWIGCGDELENGDVLIDDIIVLPQEVHATECEFTDDAIADWAEEYMDAGGDTTRFMLWGHSHVNMTVSPSQTDIDQAVEYRKTSDIFICEIYNKKGECRCDVHYKQKGIWFKNVTSTVWVDWLTDAQDKALDAKLKDCIKPIKYAVVTQPATKYSATGTMHNNVRLWITSTDTQFEKAGLVYPKEANFSLQDEDQYGLTKRDYKQYFIDYGLSGTPTEVALEIYDDTDAWSQNNNIYGDIYSGY